MQGLTAKLRSNCGKRNLASGDGRSREQDPGETWGRRCTHEQRGQIWRESGQALESDWMGSGGRIKGISQVCDESMRCKHSEEACEMPRLTHEQGLRMLPGTSLWRLGLRDPVKGGLRGTQPLLG